MIILEIYLTFSITSWAAKTFSKLSIKKNKFQGSKLEEEGLNDLSVPSVENITKLLMYEEVIEEVIKESAAKNVGKKLINKNKNLGFYDMSGFKNL